MKRVNFLLVALLFSVSLPAQRKVVADIEPFRQSMADANQKLNSIECEFTQYKYLTIMDDPLVSSGKFYYSHNDKVCLDYLVPSPYLIVLNGPKVKMVSNGKRNIYDLSSNQMVTTMKSMLSSCLLGDLSGLGSDYRMSVFESGTDYQIEIEPRSRKMKKYVEKIEVVFDKKDLSINQLIVREPSGDYTRHVFGNKKFNIPLSDQLFSLQ